MKTKIIIISMLIFAGINLSAQSFTASNKMQWICPGVEKYTNILLSLKNEDCKIYANNVKDNIELYTNPNRPSEKYLVTQTEISIENPLFDTDNFLNHVSSWIKTNYKDFEKNLKIDSEKKEINTLASVHVASHGTFIDIFKVFISPALIIKQIDKDKIIVSFSVDSYKNCVYDSNNRLSRTYNDKISEVFPFNPKSTHKNTYAKAYVATYLYFWNFISGLCDDLNANFTKDIKMIAKLKYEYSRDSLKTLYGEPTKIIADRTSTPDINKELHFYENSQKFVFMGKTIDFQDIMSCEIVDDPKFIPGRTTTLGGGLSIFGFGLGGAETVRTPDKTIHNYVVNIKIDNLGTPLIRIGTGQNEYKATEIASTFDYILRHQQKEKTKSPVVNRKRR